jgi:hypothetical protein
MATEWDEPPVKRARAEEEMPDWTKKVKKSSRAEEKMTDWTKSATTAANLTAE